MALISSCITKVLNVIKSICRVYNFVGIRVETGLDYPGHLCYVLSRSSSSDQFYKISGSGPGSNFLVLLKTLEGINCTIRVS